VQSRESSAGTPRKVLVIRGLLLAEAALFSIPLVLTVSGNSPLRLVWSWAVVGHTAAPPANLHLERIGAFVVGISPAYGILLTSLPVITYAGVALLLGRHRRVVWLIGVGSQLLAVVASFSRSGSLLLVPAIVALGLLMQPSVRSSYSSSSA